jgi:D-amino peptidase
MISADMEGATGVTWTGDVLPGTEQWQRFRRLFTGDVNACVAGLVTGGADDVLVNEAHSSQRNLLLEDLHTAARVVFLGYHAGRVVRRHADGGEGVCVAATAIT